MTEDKLPAGVLIVDDNPGKLIALGAALAGLDVEIVTANSGMRALHALLAQDFAVVLLDVNMPVMDGFETATMIRSRTRSEHLPIIFITSEALTDDFRLKGYELGAVDYILSPVLPQILRAKVATFADLYRLRQQSYRYGDEMLKKNEEIARQNNELKRIQTHLNQLNDSLEVNVMARTVALQGSEALLRESQVIARLGSYVLDIRAGVWESSDMLDQLFGIDETYERSMKGWGALIHPDDRAMVTGAFKNEVLKLGQDFDKEYRILRPGNQAEFWVHEIGKMELDAQGRPLKMLGTIQDITERMRITEALRASELQLRQITDSVPALIADLDQEQRFRFHNKAYEELFGLSFGQIDGHTLAEVLGPQNYGGIQNKVEEVLRGCPVSHELDQMTPQGELKSYAFQFFPRYGNNEEQGKVLGFFSLGTDITELKRIDRMKTEFISTVSHELRTPLTSIRGSLGLIDGGVAGEVPKAAKNLVGIAKNNCERLIRLINDILDSEKIESGKIRLDLQAVDIRQLVQQTMVAIEGFAGQHRVKLHLRAPDGPLKVRIDSDRLIQVLTNLLSNAVKFSPPQSAVEVNVLRVAQQVRVEVVDHGPGIPEEFRGRIFQKFSQADSSDSRQKGGSGLGLNISKAIIEKMGGRIGFGSEAGAGTTFFLELPEWQNPAPSLLQAVPTQAALSWPRILVCEGDAASLESDKPRILHLEDDPDVQRIVAAIAEDFAYFEFAATLNEARARLRERRFDLVLLDLELGQDSGWDLFEDIDALDPPPPVIVFSASDVDPAEGKQAEAFLVKARTSNTELLNTIQRVLQIPGDPGPTRPQPLN